MDRVELVVDWLEASAKEVECEPFLLEKLFECHAELVPRLVRGAAGDPGDGILLRRSETRPCECNQFGVGLVDMPRKRRLVVHDSFGD